MKYSRMFMFLVLMAAAAASFGAYNAAKPADNEYVADVPALVRENFRAIKDDAIVNAGTVAGLSVGNASGNIPRSNGTLNTNLNSDYLDGYHASAFNASDALNLRLDGSRAMTGSLKFSGNCGIVQSTSDGADNALTSISGGGERDVSRGGHLKIFGNEYASIGGQINYFAGNVSTGDHIFYTGAGIERMRLTYAGNLGVGVSDPVATLEVMPNIYLRNADNGSMRAIHGSRFGYSGLYKTVVVGNTSGNETVCIGYDPINNPSAVFQGNGSELIFRNGMLFMTPNSADSSFHTYLKFTDGRILAGGTVDDGTSMLQVTGDISATGNIITRNGVALASRNTAGVVRAVASIDSSDITHLGDYRQETRIDSNGTLTHNGNTIWHAANDGAGSGLDADLVHGVNLAPQEKTAQTMGAAGWFRIAQSVVGIGWNHGIISIDWAVSGYHGACHLAAGNHYGAAGGTGLNLLGLSFYPTGAPTGITKARIVYHATYSGNYAYLEVYADRNLSNTLAYRITQGLGWTLINAVAGSIPSGYTSQEIAFVDCNLNHGRMAWKTPGTYSWVCPPGVFKVWIDAVGAGGGGGGGNGTILGGGGGAGGSAKDYVVTVTPGTSYTVVVGTGGQGGISSSNSGYGGAGTDTTFGGATVGAGGAGAGDLINASEGGYGGWGATSYGADGDNGGGGKAGSGGNSIFGGGSFTPVTPLGAGGNGTAGAGTRAASGGNGFLSLAW